MRFVRLFADATVRSAAGGHIAAIGGPRREKAIAISGQVWNNRPVWTER